MRIRRCLLALALALGLATSLAPAAPADVPGMPSQAQVDLSSTDPGSFGAGWGDMPGGVAGRPYIVSLSVTNGGATTPVIVGGTTADPSVAPGAVTAVASPFNLCRSGQTPAPGVCYATPNRVGITVGYGEGGPDGWDFANPPIAVTPRIDANSVIDLTIALNTLGKSLRWTWVNGDLLFWQTHDLGQDDATVRIKFRPASAPYVATFPAGNGCTATPPMNCEIPQADGEVLTGQVVLSLDDTLDPALTGAVFATQDAIMGYLTPGGSAQAPSLDVELASTHLRSDGTPELGTLQAFIPAASLLNLYGVLPTDATTAFTITRTGDPGTNDPPAYATWTAAANGSDGVLITVGGVTFSAPSYRIAGRIKHVSVRARARGANTILTASGTGCSVKRPCIEAVYDLGRPNLPRFLARSTSVLAQKLAAGSRSIVVRASKLRKGDRFLVLVRSLRNRKLLASALGIVS
jgi:hypothetical protein